MKTIIPHIVAGVSVLFVLGIPMGYAVGVANDSNLLLYVLGIFTVVVIISTLIMLYYSIYHDVKRWLQ